LTRAGETQNLLLQPTSAGRHSSADSDDWTGIWVCVGFAEQLTEVGAVLPATIGYHAAHVRRTDTRLLAALNARPFGGCMSVPVHCGSTRNVRCPHLACAFSEDGGVLDSRTDPGGRARVEFVGDGRRTVEIPVTSWGSLIFVNVTMSDPVQLPIAGNRTPDGLEAVTVGSHLVSGNWLSAPLRCASLVVDALGSVDTQVAEIAPNLAMVHCGTDVFAAMSRPAGHTRSTIVWALLRRPGSAAAIDVPWLAGVLAGRV
jgi:hypothetical protein